MKVTVRGNHLVCQRPVNKTLTMPKLKMLTFKENTRRSLLAVRRFRTPQFPESSVTYRVGNARRSRQWANGKQQAFTRFIAFAQRDSGTMSPNRMQKRPAEDGNQTTALRVESEPKDPQIARTWPPPDDHQIPSSSRKNSEFVAPRNHPIGLPYLI